MRTGERITVSRDFGEKLCENHMISAGTMEKPMVAFDEKLSVAGEYPLYSDRVDTIQVNVGKRCNQSCKHCHVEAGPDRDEVMSRDVVDAVVRALEKNGIGTVDITGGAPEMNPHFEYLVAKAAELGKHVMIRTNLTIFLEEDKKHLPAFLKKHGAEIVASLPCYLQGNIDAQRGSGIAEKCIRVLQWLNELGYGLPDNGLTLNLVYNPAGPSLPPTQEILEADYKRELAERYGIVFSRLYALTNMPIGRFKKTLTASGELERYMTKLGDSFNPCIVDSLMCRKLVSVGWDGTLYDCDFNQMLSLPLHSDVPRTMGEFELEPIARRQIATGDHCYACTAGAGSSCGGRLN